MLYTLYNSVCMLIIVHVYTVMSFILSGLTAAAEFIKCLLQRRSRLLSTINPAYCVSRAHRNGNAAYNILQVVEKSVDLQA